MRRFAQVIAQLEKDGELYATHKAGEPVVSAFAQCQKLISEASKISGLVPTESQ